MAVERSFLMIKPNAVQRGLIGEVISRLERRGLKVVAAKFLQVTPEFAGEHYHAIKDRPSFPDIVRFIASGPVMAMVWEGPDAIGIIRLTIGATNPAVAAPGTIRGDFAVDVCRNVVHGADGHAAAEREIVLWFRPEELVAYERTIDDWISPSVIMIPVGAR